MRTYRVVSCRWRSRMRIKHLFCIPIVVCLLYGPSAQGQGKPKPTRDVVTSSVLATCADKEVKDPTALFAAQQLEWAANSPLFMAIKSRATSCSKPDDDGACRCSKPDKDGAYIFHVAHWIGTRPNGTPPYSLMSSDWYVYRTDTKGGVLKPVKLKANGDPWLYGVKRAVIVGIDVFDSGTAEGVNITYKSSATQATAQNVQALGQLVAGLLGVTLPSPTKGEIKSCKVAIAAECQNGTQRLPFLLNVAVSGVVPGQSAGGDGRSPGDAETADSNGAGTGKGKNVNSSQQTAASGVADCASIKAGNTCGFGRTFTSDDREWWDVGIGVAIPGVRESQYSISNSALQKKVITHTNLYALFDIYPFAEWFTKASGMPHLNVGLPVTGQTLYRPYFGVSENVTSWGLEKWGFPVTMSFFGGVVYMKTFDVEGAPTTSAQLASSLKATRVVKPVFGVEVPVLSLVSKLGKGSSAKSTNGGTKSSGGGGN